MLTTPKERPIEWGTRTPTWARAERVGPLGWRVTIGDADGPIDTHPTGGGGIDADLDRATQELPDLGVQKVGEWAPDRDGWTVGVVAASS